MGEESELWRRGDPDDNFVLLPPGTNDAELVGTDLEQLYAVAVVVEILKWADITGIIRCYERR